MILHPCRSRPLGASMRLAPALRKRFGDFQPDLATAVVAKSTLRSVIAVRSIGSLSLRERVRVRGGRPHPN
ncbi:hypothetical protein FFB58_07030 [Enterobacter sp. MF024]|nr:hypothetical protein FFB58_07030 [Enterobacter sp. MF024]